MWDIQLWLHGLQAAGGKRLQQPCHSSLWSIQFGRAIAPMFSQLPPFDWSSKYDFDRLHHQGHGMKKSVTGSRQLNSIDVKNLARKDYESWTLSLPLLWTCLKCIKESLSASFFCESYPLTPNAQVTLLYSDLCYGVSELNIRVRTAGLVCVTWLSRIYPTSQRSRFTSRGLLIFIIFTCWIMSLLIPSIYYLYNQVLLVT